MAREYFALSMDSLRAIGAWAADCAERVLTVYERHISNDERPRAAIEGIRFFAGGGKRTAKLRSLAWAAYSAARDASNPAAAQAAHAASLAAASAYTHPLADAHQTKHILGPAAHAALALELEHPEHPTIADDEIRWAIEHVTPAVCDVLRQMPAHQPGKTRLEALMYALDVEIRKRGEVC